MYIPFHQNIIIHNYLHPMKKKNFFLYINNLNHTNYFTLPIHCCFSNIASLYASFSLHDSLENVENQTCVCVSKTIYYIYICQNGQLQRFTSNLLCISMSLLSAPLSRLDATLLVTCTTMTTSAFSFTRSLMLSAP